jgi:hypothetical protein
MKQITIERTHQGAYQLSSTLFGETVKRQYFFPKNEAIKLFREHLLHEFLKNSLGWQSIAHTERAAAERLEAKGIIIISKHQNNTWQVRLK